MGHSPFPPSLVLPEVYWMKARSSSAGLWKAP
jgi:hypothetical protein